MADIDIDITHEFPRPPTGSPVPRWSMGCGDACPVYPGKRSLDWEMPDPSGQGAAANWNRVSLVQERSRMGQRAEVADARSTRSGFTATGVPQALSTGRSEAESA